MYCIRTLWQTYTQKELCEVEQMAYTIFMNPILPYFCHKHVHNCGAVGLCQHYTIVGTLLPKTTTEVPTPENTQEQTQNT